MKEGIHPNYNETTIKCACGATYEAGSTKESLHTDICSKCHPFFTGRQKTNESGGRIGRFNDRLSKKVDSE